MLVNFEQYNTTHNPGKDQHYKEALIPAYLEMLIDTLESLKPYYKEILKFFITRVKHTSQKAFLLNQSGACPINFVNNLYESCITFLNDPAHFNSVISFPKGICPYEKKTSGVIIQGHLRLANNSLKPLGESRGSIGCSSRAEQKEIRQQYRKAKSEGWLQTQLLTMGLSYKKIGDTRDPHAEDHYFKVKSENILQKIRDNANVFPNTRPSDAVWTTQLVGPRIEFVLPTSPCIECKNYFKALRAELNKLKIYPPIVIIARTPYNLNEATQPFFVISYNGKYINPGINWTDKFNQIPASLITVNLNKTFRSYITLRTMMDSVFLLFSKENPIYNLLFMYNLFHKKMFAGWQYITWLSDTVNRFVIKLSDGKLTLRLPAKQANMSLLQLVNSKSFDKFWHATTTNQAALVNPKHAVMFFIALFTYLELYHEHTPASLTVAKQEWKFLSFHGCCEDMGTIAMNGQEDKAQASPQIPWSPEQATISMFITKSCGINLLHHSPYKSSKYKKTEFPVNFDDWPKYIIQQSKSVAENLLACSLLSNNGQPDKGQEAKEIQEALQACYR